MRIEGVGDPFPVEWFALRVKARSEKFVATVACHKGFEQFLPLYQCRRRWSDRFKAVELPLFPGYVFCRLDPKDRLPLLTIPGVQHFVGIGKVPLPIDEAEIASIKAAISSGMRAEPWPFLSAGQRVRIEEGPLAGLEGILVKERGKHRVIVSVNLLRRSVAVEVDRDWMSSFEVAKRKVVFQVGAPLAAAVSQA